MAMAITVPRYTVDDLEHFPDDGNRYELLDGVLLVTPAPAASHQVVASRLQGRLIEAADQPIALDRGVDEARRPVERGRHLPADVGKKPLVLEAIGQRLAFTGGFTTDVPNTKDTNQGGAAIFRDGGSLDVIDCQFTNNHCARTGQDVSGGAITS